VNLAFADNPFGAMFAVDHHFRPSYAEQFNFTVEQEIAPWALVIKDGHHRKSWPPSLQPI
jgi:hypothetical protein